MSSERFVAFLRQQQTHPTPAPDWDAVRRDWLESIDTLLGQVEGWLARYQEEGVATERQTLRLCEEDLGSYDAPALRIRLAQREARLEPVSRLVIGAEGRAELSTSDRQVQLLRVPADRSGPIIHSRSRGSVSPEGASAAAPPVVWKLVVAGPIPSYERLTETAFLEALLEVVGADDAG